MDVVTLALAEQYTDSQQLGRIEPAKTITWDGVTDGKTMIPMDGYNDSFLVRISDEVIAPYSIEHIKLAVFSKDGQIDTDALQAKSYNKADFLSIEEDEDGVLSIHVLSVEKQRQMLLAVVKDDMYEEGVLVIPHGTYVCYATAEGLDFSLGVHRIELEETVHQIDPRLIPSTASTGGSGLEVVTLTTEMPDTLQDGTIQVLTPEDAVALKAAADKGVPFAIQLNTLFEGVAPGTLFNVARGVSISDPGIYLIETKIGEEDVLFNNLTEDGSWVVKAKPQSTNGGNSSGGTGLVVVELPNPIKIDMEKYNNDSNYMAAALITDSAATALSEAQATRMPIVVRYSMEVTDIGDTSTYMNTSVAHHVITDGIFGYLFSMPSFFSESVHVIMHNSNEELGWVAQVMPKL